MGAITLAPSPPKAGVGIGYWVEQRENLKILVAQFGDTTSNGTTANTIAELQTFIDAVIATLIA